jgi:hypothetical protein
MKSLTFLFGIAVTASALPSQQEISGSASCSPLEVLVGKAPVSA